MSIWTFYENFPFSRKEWFREIWNPWVCQKTDRMPHSSARRSLSIPSISPSRYVTCLRRWRGERITVLDPSEHPPTPALGMPQKYTGAAISLATAAPKALAINQYPKTSCGQPLSKPDMLISTAQKCLPTPFIPKLYADHHSFRWLWLPPLAR